MLFKSKKMIAAVTLQLICLAAPYRLSSFSPSLSLYSISYATMIIIIIEYTCHSHLDKITSVSKRFRLLLLLLLRVLKMYTRIYTIRLFLRIILHHRTAMNDVTYSIMTCQRNDHSKKKLKKEKKSA